MRLKLTAAAAASVLLAPAVVAIGVATLISPAAAGSSGCLWDSPTGGPSGAGSSVAVTGPVPAALSAVNGHGETVRLSKRQLARAATIVAVGRSAGVPARGQLIAVMTALTESSLRVLSNTSAYPSSAALPHDGDGGDHDSLGLFQQRPSAGWGTVAEVMDPVWSARAFYGGPEGPNHGAPRGLLDIEGWQSMAPGAAAQAVQGSAFPDRYALNEPVAEKVLATLGGLAATGSLGGPLEGSPACATPDAQVTVGLPALPAGFAGALIMTAATQLGTPYVWGGGNFLGPTGGGFDCSGLVLFAAYQASGGRIRLPHYTGDQIHLGHPVAWSAKEPGDLVFFSYPGAGHPHHVAIYLGGDRILQAPHTGDVVRYGTLGEFSGQVMTVRRIN